MEKVCFLVHGIPGSSSQVIGSGAAGAASRAIVGGVVAAVLAAAAGNKIKGGSNEKFSLLPVPVLLSPFLLPLLIISKTLMRCGMF
jgi:hypothetical protein